MTNENPNRPKGRGIVYKEGDFQCLFNPTSEGWCNNNPITVSGGVSQTNEEELFA